MLSDEQSKTDYFKQNTDECKFLKYAFPTVLNSARNSSSHTGKIFIKFYFLEVLIKPVQEMQVCLKSVKVAAALHVDVHVFMTTCILVSNVTTVVSV